MTARQKAKEMVDRIKNTFIVVLVDEFGDGNPSIISTNMTHNSAIEIVTISIDEILKAIPEMVSMYGYGSAMTENPDVQFWKNVKFELGNV